MEEGQNQDQNNGLVGANLGMKVMTDEQLEMLRKQICVYAAISDSLIQMHKSMTAQQDITGMMRVPSTYNGQFLSYAFHKIPSRQRWAPKQAQLQILESIFEQSSVTPDRHRIKEITSQLAVHGPISETNVYNWFQNRRARSKRKQQASSVITVPSNNNGESDQALTEPSIEYGGGGGGNKEKRSKSDDDGNDAQLDENLQHMVKHMYYQSPPEMGGIDQLIGKTDPLGYNGFYQID